MSAQAVSKGILSIGSWSVVKMATSALVLPILARMLGIEGYGQYAYYMALLLLASQFANVGMMQTMTKRIAERPEDVAWCRAVAHAGALINAVGLLSVSVVVGLVVGTTAPAGTAALPIALVIVGVLMFDQVWFYARGVLHGLRHEARAAIPGMIGVVSAGLLGVLAATAGLGVTGVFAGLLTANLFVAMACLRAVLKVLSGSECRESGRTVSSVTGPLLRFGLPAMLFSVLNMALCSLDVILVRHLAGEAQAGLYAAAIQWSQFVWFIPIAVEGVMLQATARLWAEQRVDEVSQLVGRLVRYVVVGTTFLLLLVAVLGEQIVTVYFGPRFADAALGLRLLVPGALCYAVARVLWPVIQAGGEGGHLVRLIGMIVLVDVGLCGSLIPLWGAAGAAMATSISFALVAVGYVWMLHRRRVQVFEQVHLFRWLLLSMGTALAIALVAAWVTPPLLSILVGAVVGTVLYWGGVFRLGLVQVEEIELMVCSLPGAFRLTGERLFRSLAPVLLRLKAAAWS